VAFFIQKRNGAAYTSAKNLPKLSLDYIRVLCKKHHYSTKAALGALNKCAGHQT